MAKRKRHKVKFTEKKHSIRGMISTGIAIVAVLLATYITYRTTRSGGNSSAIIGLAGLCLLGLNMVGVVLAAVSFKQKEIYYTWPIIGVSVNGIMLVGLVILYFLGMSI